MSIQIASADEDRYGELLALVEQKKGKFLGERYDDRGVKQIAVEAKTDAKPNEQIRIGREFFTTALRDYADWQEKWFRECIQNSVDGGATKVDIVVQETPDGVIVSCEDNGRGMDRDVLLNKFLVLGGTTKVGAGGSTGGFGKAKELLVLPWLTWSVHTRDALVEGSGIEYEVKDAPYLSGTKLTVVMPVDQATRAAAAEAFIEKCYLTGITFTVNGKVINSRLRKGEELLDFDGKATLYHNKKAEGNYAALLVRANGLYMFYIYVTAGVPGTLILELTRPSIELLSANRDGFRDFGLKKSVEQYINQLAKDTASALRKKKGMIREKFRGTGKFEVTHRDLQSAMLESEGAILPATKTMSADQVEKIAEVLDYVEKQAEEEEGTSWTMASDESAQPVPVLRANGDLARAMLDDLKIAGTTQLEAAIAQLSWTPDFFLINEIENFRVPSTLKPGKMAVRVKQLLTYWAELCRFILIQLGSKTKYGVGFIVSEEVAAAHLHEGGEDWLLLNPFKKKPKVKEYSWEEAEAGEFYALSDKDDLAWLYAAAVHECTHIADGVIYHDESFSTAFTVNVAKTSGKLKQLGAIRKAIVARQEKAPVPAGEPQVKLKAHNYIVSRRGQWGGDLGEVKAASPEAAIELYNRGNPGYQADEARDWDDKDDGLWWTASINVTGDNAWAVERASDQAEARGRLGNENALPVWMMSMDVWEVAGASPFKLVASTLPKSKLLDQIHYGAERGKGTYKAWLKKGGEPIFLRKIATAKGMAKRAEKLDIAINEWLVLKIDSDGREVLSEGNYKASSAAEALDKMAGDYGYTSYSDYAARPHNEDYHWVAHPSD